MDETKQDDNVNVIAHLQRTQLFGDLDQEELRAVARCVVPRRCRKGETLLVEGTPGESLFLLLDGRIAIEKNKDGEAVTLAELGRGAVLGEMSLIDSRPTSATARALEDSELLSLSRLDLDVLLTWNTLLASKLWRSFTEILLTRLRDMNERLLERYGVEALRED